MFHNSPFSEESLTEKKALAVARAFFIFRVLANQINYYWQLAGKRLASNAVVVVAVPVVAAPAQVQPLI